MKKILPLLIILFTVAAFTVYKIESEHVPVTKVKHKSTFSKREARMRNLIEHYKAWHYPYGVELPQDLTSQMWSQIDNMPQEIAPVNSWYSIGPYGAEAYDNSKYSGRLRDIEIENGMVRVAASTGGLWGYQGLVPVPLSDKVRTMRIGAFASKPGDANTIFLGTGDADQMDGSIGMYKTTNGGNTWTNVDSLKFIGVIRFYKIMYSPGSTTVLHAITNKGYFRSTDSGENWLRNTSIGDAWTTDIDIDPSDPNIIYVGIANDGLYKATNGVSFSKIQTGGLPGIDIGRISIAVCRNFPDNVYIIFNRQEANWQKLKGVYKTTNKGTSWTTITPSSWYMEQMDYNQLIGVSPTNPNIVFTGGVHLYRSSNGGSTWKEMQADTNIRNRLHPDNHCIAWSQSGNSVYIGNDGGLSVSLDQGITWSNQINTFPIYQFYHIDIGVSWHNNIIGGSQDNGMPHTTNGGLIWKGSAGDAWDVAIDSWEQNVMFTTTWNGSGNFKYKSTNSGASWIPLHGSFIDTLPGHSFVSDRASIPTYFTENANKILFLVSPWSAWNLLSAVPTAFPIIQGGMAASVLTPGPRMLYVPVASPVADSILRVYDNGQWYGDRTPVVSDGLTIHKITAHPRDNNKAYVLMNGLDQANKVFRTTNRGISWQNLTSNLPNVPVADIVPHPTDDNKLYLGSQFGCFRSTNSGASWQRWNYGLPDAVEVSEMGFIDSTNINGKFYVAIGTYGRSMSLRDASGDDLIGIQSNTGIPVSFSLSQNYPNPFNPLTKIDFDLPSSEIVTLSVFDITGKEVMRILNNKKHTAGKHSVQIQGQFLSSGVYFYSITAGKFAQTKKMIVLK